MSTNQINLKKTISPSYKKFTPLRKDLDSFVEKLQQCIDNIIIIDKKNESEEHLKSPIKRFLEQTFYSKYEINTKERIDLAIYLGDDATSNVGVIIEAKRISNKSEFPSPENLNKKAFHELLHYYLRERIDLKNNNIKHLIITNGLEWFFFKGEDFYEFFYKNRSLVNQYKQFRDGLKDTTKNELFYNEIASSYIGKIADQIPFVYQDFRKKKISEMKEKELVDIYKLFSDVNLLGKSFGNDSNKLNKEFYNELLYIIGLEEVKDGSKRIIQRKAENDRDYGSLIENTIFTLEDRDYLGQVKDVQNDGNKSFVIGLELCLTWINRILFLKLLESQLLSYNGNDNNYRFLNINFNKGFDDLNDLFFSALAKPLNERHSKFAKKFNYVPYLNSSLFERSRIESLTFDITSLKDEDMNVYSSTVLKDNNGKKFRGKLNTLEYIFRFLESYDFSTETGIDIGDNQDRKSLINASVLGLIFEKINGYKDGSFYTPGMITMFMCKETIRNVVVQKFRSIENEEIEDFDDLKSYCTRFYKKEDVLRFNNIIKDIKICDPAVGSGHFLVSALNELIAIKSELHILVDEQGKHLPCDVTIENDELYISDASGELFEYYRNDPNSLRIQKTIFHEKQNIIENSLFGVDLNPNSVNICRLRLWIELLKNAYYTIEGELQTLPNIDINIKNGNSLVSRFSLQDSLKAAFKNKDIVYSIEDYKRAVNDYKHTNSKNKKREVLEIIDTIKNTFKSTLDKKIIEKVQKARGEYDTEDQRQQNLILFGEKLKKSDKDNLKKLKQKADKAQKEKEEILNNVNFKNAFEWRFEFPEVLDNDGNFIGFDIVIGNPPYIQLQKMGAESDLLQKMNFNTYAKTGDIYSLFYELGYHILRPKGLLTFITSNKWMRAAYGESLRKFLAEKTDPLVLIDFGGIQIFDTATVDTNILTFAKDKNRQQTQACIIKDRVLNNLSIFFKQNKVISKFETSDSWIVLSEIEKTIKYKIETAGVPLKDWDIQINYGIKTGLNEAFIINANKKKELIDQDPKSAEIIRPLLRGRDIKRYLYQFADLYLITTFPSLKLDIELYPAVKQHLISFGYDRLKQTGDLGARKKTNNQWFETQDSISYWEDFSKQKIVWKRVGSLLRFSFDETGCFALDSTCFATGKHLKYLVAILNSSIGKYLLKDSPQTGTGDLLISVQAIEPLKIPLPDAEDLIKFDQLIDQILLECSLENILLLEQEIETLINNKFKFNKEEAKYIKNGCWL